MSVINNLILFLFLFLSFERSHGQCVSNSTCFAGECVQDNCICASGVTGASCTQSAVDICGSSYLNLFLSDVPPDLDSNFTRIADNTLFIRVSSPLYNNRLSSYLHLRNATAYPECAFNTWSKRVENCVEVYELVLSWSTAVRCGWVAGAVTETEAFFNNLVYITHHDIVTYFRTTPIYRTTVHSFLVSVVLQTTITLPLGSTSSITTQVPPDTASVGSLVTSEESLDVPVKTGGASYWPYIVGGALGLVLVAGLTIACFVKRWYLVLSKEKRKTSEPTIPKRNRETTALDSTLDLEASLPVADSWVPPARLNLEGSLPEPFSPISSPTPLLKLDAPNPGKQKKKRSPPRERPLPSEMEMEIPRLELPLSPDMARPLSEQE